MPFKSHFTFIWAKKYEGSEVSESELVSRLISSKLIFVFVGFCFVVVTVDQFNFLPKTHSKAHFKA